MSHPRLAALLLASLLLVPTLGMAAAQPDAGPAPAAPAQEMPPARPLDAALRFFEPDAAGGFVTPFDEIRLDARGLHLPGGIVMRFAGAAPVAPVGREPLPGVSHHLRGDDPAFWRTDVPHVARVDYPGLAQGVDATFYFNADGLLEYDLLVAPHVDHSAIRLAFDGAASVEVTPLGDLLVRAEDATVTHRAPRSFEVAEDGAREVPSRYEVSPDGLVSILVEDRDPGLALVVDPVVSYWKTYAHAGNQDSFEVASDADGNAYVAGYVQLGTFPGTDPFGTGGGTDAVVMKVGTSGTLQWSTFLGGTAGDHARALAVAPDGHVFVGGFTDGGFPVTSGAFATTNAGGATGFVAKLAPSGSSLAYATYLGGSGIDGVEAIALDGSGHAYAVGQTRSSDFPLVAARHDVRRGATDAFVTKLSPSGAAVFSTLLGGGHDDVAHDVAVDGGFVYVVGHTSSWELTGLTPTGQGLYHGFLVTLSADGQLLLHESPPLALGFEAISVAVDPLGFVYVGGTLQDPFPRPSAAQPLPAGLFQPTPDPLAYNDGFVAKLTPGGAAMVWSTRLGGHGGGGWDNVVDIALDPTGAVYVFGITTTTMFAGTAPLSFRNINPYGSEKYTFLARINASGHSLDMVVLMRDVNCSPGGDISAGAVAVTPAGSVLTTGSTYQCSSTQRDVYLDQSARATVCDMDPPREQQATIPGAGGQPERHVQALPPNNADGAKVGVWEESNGKPGLQTRGCTLAYGSYEADRPVDPLALVPPLPEPDQDGDGVKESDEARGHSDPTRPQSTPSSDDDGDGVANRDEASRLHASGVITGPAVRVTASDRVTFHFGAPGATATVRGPGGERMSVTYLPGEGQDCPGSVPRVVGDVVEDCTRPVVATFDLAGGLVSARAASDPSLAVDASAFRVSCSAGARLACLLDAAMDGTWVVTPAQQAPRASAQAKVPAGWAATLGGKTFVDVASDSGDITTGGSGQNSRDALMPVRLWNWHTQAPGTTYAACSGGLAAPCATEAPPQESALYALVFP